MHHRRTALLPPADIDDIVPAVALEDLRALAESGLLDAVVHLSTRSVDTITGMPGL